MQKSISTVPSVSLAEAVMGVTGMNFTASCRLSHFSSALRIFSPSSSARAYSSPSPSRLMPGISVRTPTFNTPLSCTVATSALAISDGSTRRAFARSRSSTTAPAPIRNCRGRFPSSPLKVMSGRCCFLPLATVRRPCLVKNLNFMLRLYPAPAALTRRQGVGYNNLICKILWKAGLFWPGCRR